MDMKKVGNYISKKRKALDMSQHALGDYLAVTDKAVSKWERGLACPDVDNLKSMALLFNCSISEILNGENQDLNKSSNLPANTSADIDNENYACDTVVDFNFNSTKYISPFLFGDNLEHTRDCINSGISAQMLKNRKFVGKPGRYGCAVGWYQIGERTYMTFGAPYTKHAEGYKMKRAHECNSQIITNYTSGIVSGFGQKELCIKANTAYEFCIISKAFSKTTLTITLSSACGKVYAKTQITVDSLDFAEYKAVLVPDADDKNANIEITFTDTATVHVGAISLMPADNFCGMRCDVIEKMKEIGIKLLRWPGGNFAGEYNWKDGLLPRDERAPFQAYLWLETQPHTLGYDFHEINTDDFICLCREIGAQPFITINPTWNTPEESAQWVEYCNGDENTTYGKLRAECGHKEPYNVQFWSLGNEFGYGHMEGANTPYDYSKIVTTHANEMLKVSPDLTLCSSGPYPHTEWANHSAKVLSHFAPLVSLHHYAQYPEFIDSTKRREEYYGFINKVYTEYLPKIQKLREQLNDNSIKISFDEWNAWYAWYRGGSVSEGILAAAFMNMLFMNADEYGIELACHFESVNEGAIQVHPDCVTLTPTGQVFSIMKHHANGMVCALQKDVIATRKNNVLSCTLINRSFDQDKTFTVPCLSDVISATLYSACDVVPHTVFEQSTLQVKKDAKSITLPAHSIALIQIKLSKAE